MGETDLRCFEGGERAFDRESDDDSQMLVLGPHGKTAEEYYISALGQTVAEVNLEYPASDPVADVAFVEGIEAALGLDWVADDVLQLDADHDQRDFGDSALAAEGGEVKVDHRADGAVALPQRQSETAAQRVCESEFSRR